jgi:hypothetical protein
MHNDIDKGNTGRGISGHFSVGRCQIREVKFTAQVVCTTSLPGYLSDLIFFQFFFFASPHTLLCHYTCL